nr:hypothetical protein GZ13E1_21 [uncultured archaeon GZfos13E1]
MIYHRGERRVRRVLRLFQSLLRLSGAFAFSVCSAMNFEDIYGNFTRKFDRASPTKKEKIRVNPCLK